MQSREMLFDTVLHYEHTLTYSNSTSIILGNRMQFYLVCQSFCRLLALLLEKWQLVEREEILFSTTALHEVAITQYTWMLEELERAMQLDSSRLKVFGSVGVGNWKQSICSSLFVINSQRNLLSTTIQPLSGSKHNGIKISSFETYLKHWFSVGSADSWTKPFSGRLSTSFKCVNQALEFLPPRSRRRLQRTQISHMVRWMGKWQISRRFC